MSKRTPEPPPEPESLREPSPLDPITMARFLVLPGATELLDAFARIPPGPLRGSLIEHARVMADTYTGAPAEMQMPDPLLSAARVTVPPLPQIAGPIRRRREPSTVEERIVVLRMEGKHVAEIVAETGADRLKVEATIKTAQRAGGLRFPKLSKGSHVGPRFVIRMEDVGGQGRGPMERAAAQRGMSLEQYVDARAGFVRLRKANTPMEEIAAAVRIDEATLWDWLYRARAAGIELPTQLDFEEAEIEEPPGAKARRPPAKAAPGARKSKGSASAGGFPINADEVAIQHLKQVGDAAAALGRDVDGYFALRREALQLVRDGLNARALNSRLKLGVKRAANWVSAMRRAGLVPPRPAKAPDPEPDPVFEPPIITNSRADAPPPPEPTEPGARAFPLLGDHKRSARHQIERAAKSRGMTTQAYMDLRESVVRHRLEGVGPHEIAQLVGEQPFFVKDILKAATVRGVVFPSLATNPFDELHRILEAQEAERRKASA